MKIRVDHCYYDLVKELLLSHESLVESVEKYGEDVLITLRQGKTQFDLIDFLSKDPLYQFTKFSTLHVMWTLSKDNVFFAVIALFWKYIFCKKVKNTYKFMHFHIIFLYINNNIVIYNS